MSGAVIDPGAPTLLPQWRGEDALIATAVADDRFYMLGRHLSRGCPTCWMPPLMSNRGTHRLTRQCAAGSPPRPKRRASKSIRASAAEVMFWRQRRGRRHATGDMGIGRDGRPKASFTRGWS
jgi:electron-transferring-flavoprotein dehydrogenase